MPKQPRMTNFKKAWSEFRKSNDYKELSDILKDQGIKFRYRNNIIWTAFAAGWKASGVKTA